MGICCFCAGGLSRATDNAAAGHKAGVGGAATFFVFLFTAIFGATWLTVPWLYPAEIFPLQVRARGNAWGVVGWSIGNGWCVSYANLSHVYKVFILADMIKPGPPSAYDFCKIAREDPLHFWRCECVYNLSRLGTLSRNEPAYA